MKHRLDVELVRRGLAPTRAQARQYVRDGFVRLDGAPARRPGRGVAPDAAIEVDPEASRYVGRGGRKLACALDAFGLDPGGLRVLDVGAGTGGFTDVLLQRGAAHVIAVDAGHGQFAPALRRDPRVDAREGADIREIYAIEPPVDAVVVDVSSSACATCSAPWSARRRPRNGWSCCSSRSSSCPAGPCPPTAW